jgi:hypothetical protein
LLSAKKITDNNRFSLQVPAGLIAKNTSQPVILSGVRELKCTKQKTGKKCGRFA